MIALLAVSILIRIAFNAGLAYDLNRATGGGQCVAAALGLIDGEPAEPARRRVLLRGAHLDRQAQGLQLGLDHRGVADHDPDEL